MLFCFFLFSPALKAPIQTTRNATAQSWASGRIFPLLVNSCTIIIHGPCPLAAPCSLFLQRYLSSREAHSPGTPYYYPLLNVFCNSHPYLKSPCTDRFFLIATRPQGFISLSIYLSFLCLFSGLPKIYLTPAQGCPGCVLEEDWVKGQTALLLGSWFGVFLHLFLVLSGVVVSSGVWCQIPTKTERIRRVQTDTSITCFTREHACHMHRGEP